MTRPRSILHVLTAALLLFVVSTNMEGPGVLLASEQGDSDQVWADKPAKITKSKKKKKSGKSGKKKSRSKRRYFPTSRYKMYNSLNEYVRYNENGARDNIMISMDGQDLKAPFSNHTCVYYESALLLQKGDKIEKYSSLTYSDNDFAVIIDGKHRIKVKKGMRLYLNPTFVKSYTADSEAGEAIRNILEKKEYDRVTRAEYALQKHKRYYARIVRESYKLRPDKSSSEAVEAFDTVIYISDKPFRESKSQLPPSPRSNWTY